jgi:hypothetical protein
MQWLTHEGIGSITTNHLPQVTGQKFSSSITCWTEVFLIFKSFERETQQLLPGETPYQRVESIIYGQRET